MAYSSLATGLTERQQLAGGTIALLLATVCMLALAMTGGSVLIGAVLGLLSVAFFVLGTISIGTSDGDRI